MQQINWHVALIGLFLLGFALVRISYALPGAIQAPPVPWPQRIDDSAIDLDQQAKIELIERMGLIGAPWCEEILKQADSEESDSTLRRAIAFALADCHQAMR
ncbi:MAG: hypothetical protein M3N19_12720 [Candidatus Eremiobacteraeota bacterium]|nr:hypothetical protein [Candidatus Eremiobacteraeota bacterium]